MSICCAFPASSPNFLARKRPAAHEASESSCNPSSGTKSEEPNIFWVEIEQQLPSYPIQISPLTSETIIFRFQGPVIKTGWWNPFPNSPHLNLGPRSTSSGFSRYCAGFRHRLQAPFDPKVSERFDAETPQRTQLRILNSWGTQPRMFFWWQKWMIDGIHGQVFVIHYAKLWSILSPHHSTHKHRPCL